MMFSTYGQLMPTETREEKMSVQCPKCGYTRTPTDRAPDYECPSCGVVYKKYEAFLGRSAEQAEVKDADIQEHERWIPRRQSQATHETEESEQLNDGFVETIRRMKGRFITSESERLDAGSVETPRGEIEREHLTAEVEPNAASDSDESHPNARLDLADESIIDSPDNQSVSNGSPIGSPVVEEGYAFAICLIAGFFCLSIGMWFLLIAPSSQPRAVGDLLNLHRAFIGMTFSIMGSIFTAAAFRPT
jgi:ribosomal protein S27E